MLESRLGVRYAPLGFATLVTLGEEITASLEEPNRSRARDGARSRANAFEWVIGD